jgi:adenylylsulfate kinase-like enzyme
MIYWFTGQPGTGKTIQANKLKELLQTEKRNWRKDVFHIDNDTFDINEAQIISAFLNNNNCDVVVSMTSPDLKQREEFKSKCGDGIVEIYVHANKKKLKDRMCEYEQPHQNFFDMNTTSDNPVQSFTKLVHYLRENDKI